MNTLTCKSCKNPRIVKNLKKAKSVFCRNCGLKNSMYKRSKNKKWRERLSIASRGIKKTEKHKKSLSIAAQNRKKVEVTLKNSIKYNQKLKNSPNSWTINRSVCIERDGGRCRHCGTKNNLEVHHMNPYKKSQNNHIDNLITLCVKHHRLAEENRRPNQSKKLCGVLLAGGRGTRLAPHTVFHNKHELPVGAVPMIFHSLMSLRELRITDVMVVLSRSNIGRIMEMVGDGSEFGLNVSYKIQNSAGGIAEALLLTESFVRDREVYVILGDNIYDYGEFSKKQASLLTQGKVFLKEVEDPREYGVAIVKGRKVIEVEEKPKKPKSNLAVTGLYYYKSSVFKYLKTIKPSARGELEISDLNDLLAKKGELSFEIVNGSWKDAGCSIESYIQANLDMLKYGL